MMYDFNMFGGLFGWGSMPAWAPTFFILMLAWSLFWKGMALWHSARREQPWWFVIILLVNTVGILEIAYLFFVAKIKPADLLTFKKESH